MTRARWRRRSRRRRVEAQLAARRRDDGVDDVADVGDGVDVEAPLDDHVVPVGRVQHLPGIRTSCGGCAASW